MVQVLLPGGHKPQVTLKGHIRRPAEGDVKGLAVSNFLLLFCECVTTFCWLQEVGRSHRKSLSCRLAIGLRIYFMGKTLSTHLVIRVSAAAPSLKTGGGNMCRSHSYYIDWKGLHAAASCSAGHEDYLGAEIRGGKRRSSDIPAGSRKGPVCLRHWSGEARSSEMQHFIRWPAPKNRDVIDKIFAQNQLVLSLSPIEQRLTFRSALKFPTGT